jgi:tRNA pseudouridine38-40 synthase
MRYFLEVSYKGTNYSGFQIQSNANTIQSEIERALYILLKQKISLTGSSRTDAGVHALQNYFHFDIQEKVSSNVLYNLNAILPSDIVCKNLIHVFDSAHCRFDALSREYNYYLYYKKNPFLKDRGFFYPYKLNLELMNMATEIIKNNNDFSSFSKSRTQVKNFICNVSECEWYMRDDCIVFHVKANRFLRGMVRALTATMLKIGREILTMNEFITIIEAKESKKTNFSVPAQGLFLIAVNYPADYWNNKNIICL